MSKTDVNSKKILAAIIGLTLISSCNNVTSKDRGLSSKNSKQSSSQVKSVYDHAKYQDKEMLGLLPLIVAPAVLAPAAMVVLGDTIQNYAGCIAVVQTAKSIKTPSTGQMSNPKLSSGPGIYGAYSNVDNTSVIDPDVVWDCVTDKNNIPVVGDTIATANIITVTNKWFDEEEAAAKSLADYKAAKKKYDEKMAARSDDEKKYDHDRLCHGLIANSLKSAYDSAVYHAENDPQNMNNKLASQTSVWMGTIANSGCTEEQFNQVVNATGSDQLADPDAYALISSMPTETRQQASQAYLGMPGSEVQSAVAANCKEEEPVMPQSKPVNPSENEPTNNGSKAGMPTSTPSGSDGAKVIEGMNPDESNHNPFPN